MKLIDNPNSILRATRNIPSMTKGSISYDIKFTSFNATLYTELKASYNNVHHRSAPLAFYVNNGVVTVRGTSNNAIPTSAQVSIDKWYNFRVDFDFEENQAKLYFDGEFIAEMPIDSERGSFVSTIQLSDASSMNAGGTAFYIDNFKAINYYDPNVIVENTEQILPRLEEIILVSDKTILEPGETASLSVSGFMNDEKEADLTNAITTYGSTHPELIRIDENGNLVLAEDVGGIRSIGVWAVVTLDGVSIQSNTIDITIAGTEPIYYTIIFDSQGGSHVKEVTVEEGQTIAKPSDPIRAGFAFEGWYIDEDYTTKWKFEDGITSDMTLYAKWVKNVVPKTGEEPTNLVWLLLIAIVSGCALIYLLTRDKKAVE